MRLLKNILCPFDFSEFSTLALRYAGALALENEADLLIYHTVPDLEQAIRYMEVNYIRTVNDLLTSSAFERLKNEIRDQTPHGVKTAIRVGTGDASTSILEVAKETEADLIVMGTHGHSGHNRLFTGSVTNKVLHKANVPVMVVCEPSRNFIPENPSKAIELKHILCPVDLEYGTQAVRDLALSIARLYQSELHFLHVTNPPLPNADIDDKKLTMGRLHDLADPGREDWCKVKFHAEEGNPADRIVSAIDSLNIDLVVMGHHCRRPIEELLLGSVAKRIVVESKCPVVVTRFRSSVFP